jgi:hypothetical protein
VGSGHVGASMQQPRQVAVMLVNDQCVGLQDRLEPLASVTGVVSDLGELLEVLGDLGHRHRRQPALGHQGRGGVQGGVAHRLAAGDGQVMQDRP